VRSGPIRKESLGKDRVTEGKPNSGGKTTYLFVAKTEVMGVLTRKAQEK
jgi:hypothetical protein